MAFTVDWPGEVPMKFETLAPPTAPPPAASKAS